MESFSWCINEGRIGLLTAQGEHVPLNSMDVFRAVFGRDATVAGYPVSVHPFEELTELTFSRFPAEPAVHLSDTDGEIWAETGVMTDTGFVPLNAGADQVIAGSRWYPVAAGAVSEAAEWLSGMGVRPGEPLSIGTLIALRASAQRPVRLVDDVRLTSATVAADPAASNQAVAGLNATLYPYQTGGVAFLQLIARQGVGCVLADEMGLGKTLQVIALLQSEKNEGRGPSLVVAPATLLENWRREIAQFAPGLTVHVHAGPGRPGIAPAILSYDVTVVSYETAVNDEPLLSAVSWNVIALDEAQNIKNPDAQRTMAVKRLPRRVSLAVTGTPVENRLEDLWSIADFTLPGLLGTLNSFRAEYRDELHDASRLAPLVAPLFLRRRVANVAKDLPEKIEILQPLKMSVALAQGYENVRKQTYAEYSGAAGLVATTRLRTYSAHPALSGDWAEDPAYQMPKYIRMLEILEEVFSLGEKALVFTTFQGMVDILLADVPRRFGSGFFRYIDGRVEVAARQPLVDEFFAFRSYGALFLNPKAAGTGLNITAANHVIHYNPEWNPALTAQASARAYRRRQERPVTIHHLFFAGTVEEVITDRAEFKRQLAGEAVTGHEGDSDPSLIARALEISPLADLQRLET